MNDPESTKLIVLGIIGGFFALVFVGLKIIDGLKKLRKEHLMLTLKWIDKNKYLIVFILGFSMWFYWAQLRPVFIKKDCASQTQTHNRYGYDRDYKECLQLNGL